MDFQEIHCLKIKVSTEAEYKTELPTSAGTPRREKVLSHKLWLRYYFAGRKSYMPGWKLLRNFVQCLAEFRHRYCGDVGSVLTAAEITAADFDVSARLQDF